MMRTSEAAETPWRRGPFKQAQSGLIFGMMYEDPAIELRAFKPHSRVFCIAGAGCTARALAAAGHSVTAVDINPRQIAYAKSRIAGSAPQMGSVERLMMRGRTFARLFGWNRRILSNFLELSNPDEQLDYWDHHLDTRRWRLMLDTLLAPRLLGLCYSGPFIQSLPRDFGRQIRHRLRRGWARHSNRDNPYAAALLLGKQPVETSAPESPVHFVCGDAAGFLENCAPAHFDAFTLSNIADGAPPEYVGRLRAAIEQAAAPGAVIVTRSFAEPQETPAENWAALDRSLLWGAVEVNRMEGGRFCSIF
jgi:S-adenosylmethionine:diacylglycerol 3-amino-3-carboxypropyl transferase